MSHILNLVLFLLPLSAQALFGTHFALRDECPGSTTCVDGSPEYSASRAWGTWLGKGHIETSRTYIIAPEMLPAWAFKQRKTASEVINLYINPESMFFAFEVNKLLKYCPEYMAEEE